jgi:hypothetical protein
MKLGQRFQLGLPHPACTAASMQKENAWRLGWTLLMHIESHLYLPFY